MAEFNAGDDCAWVGGHVRTKHLDKLPAGHIWKTFTSRFFSAILWIDCHRSEELTCGGDDFDLAEFDDLLAGFQSLAFAAAHQAVTGLEKLPAETPRDVLRSVHKLILCEAE